MRITIIALLSVLVVLNVVDIALQVDRMDELCDVVDRMSEATGSSSIF